MELEKLKEILSQSAAAEHEVSAESLQKLLSTKSKSPISKMKRNLLIELSIMIFLYGYIVFYYSNQVAGLSWLLIGVELIYLVYFIIKYRLLNRLGCPSCEIQSNLRMQLNALESLLRFYLWSGIMLVPLASLVSFWIGYVNSPPTALPKELSFLLLTSAIILAVSLLLCIPLFFFTKWYIHKLYGHQIGRAHV